MGDKGFRVTVEDLESGETGTRVVGVGDYILMPFAPCYLDGIVQHSNGTVQLTLKGHAPEAVSADGE